MLFAPSDLACFVLVLARTSGAMAALPGIGEEGVPPRVRVAMAIALAVFLSPLVADSLAPRLAWPLPLSIITETAIGLVMGLLVRCAYATAVTVGAYIAAQIGLSGALFFDPSLGGQSTAVTRLISVGATMILLVAGFHHQLLTAFAASYTIFDVNLAIGDVASYAVALVAGGMRLAAELSAPFLIYGVVFNLALGLVNRLTPQIQLFFIAQPLNLLLGLALLAATAGPLLIVFANRIAPLLALSGGR